MVMVVTNLYLPNCFLVLSLSASLPLLGLSNRKLGLRLDYIHVNHYFQEKFIGAVVFLFIYPFSKVLSHPQIILMPLLATLLIKLYFFYLCTIKLVYPLQLAR